MNHIATIIVTLLFSAFFSGMEIAFVSSNKLKIELDRKQGTFSSKIINIFTRNPGQYLVTMLVGNNIALVIYGITMAVVLEPVLFNIVSSEVTVFILQTLFATILILLVAEFMPKALFLLKSNLALNVFALPLLFFYVLFYPVTRSTIGISNFLLKYVLKAKAAPDKKKTAFGKIDLDHFVKESQDELKEDDEIKNDIKIFQNALDFSSIKLRECMVPRPEIVAFEMNSSIEEIKQAFIETGYSRILIYKDTIDNIIGYINSKDLFRNPGSIRDVINRIIIVPETMPANKLLSLFIKEKKSIAIVVDEFGGTGGMITIEDVMEEIFGEIEDEHDTTDLEEKQTGENEYLFSGRLEIDYLNEKYKINIPKTDDYETLAGFILFHHESIPKANQKVIIKPFEFKILKITKTKVDLVSMKIAEK